jgi:histidine triad (HIT) family protein
MSENDCIFCKIAAGEIPSYKVYEDDDVVAFLDLHPVNPGHTLVVPKEHVEFFEDMGGERYQNVMNVVQLIARKIKTELKPVRVGLMIWGFEVPHAHVHVVPLNKAEDFGMNRPNSAEASQTELELVKIKLS